MDKQSSASKGSTNSLDSGADSKHHSPVTREVEPGSLRSFLQASQTELDDADDEFDPRQGGSWPAHEEDGYPQEEGEGEDEESEGESIDEEDNFDAGYDGALDESAILPYIPEPTAYGLTAVQMQHPRPYLLIANEALRHFWEQYFADKQYVRWTTFVNKLEIHLSSPAQNDTQEAESKSPAIQTGAKLPARQQGFPVAPNGYGLHPNELFTLFREREGKRNLTKALQYALDFDGSGVLSVHQVAIVVQHILPASLPLKHLLFHLAHLGGKVILPATLYPVASAARFAARLQDAFQRAVAAEKDFTIQQQKNQQLARAAGNSSASGAAAASRAAAEMSHSMVGLYSPYAYCYEDLQGPVALQDSIETFIGVGRGIYNNQDNASSSGGVTVLAAPCGQGTTTRVVSAVRSQLHNTLQRRHALLNHAAAQGNLSVWDLLHGDQTTDASRTAATLLAAQPLTQATSMQKEVYTVKQVADDDFVLAGLFDVVYIDLRGRTSKSDVLTAFSTQLALRGADVSLRAVQESLQRFLRSLRTSSVLILDHVHSTCAAVVKKLLSSSLTLSVEKNAVSVVVIPAMQCASPILSANAGEALHNANPKLQKYYGSAGRRRIAWEKEQEAKSTTFFLEELKAIVTNFGIRWNSSPNQNGEAPEESAEELVLPSSVMLMTYCLTSEETRAAAVKMHQEVQIRERLGSLQRQEIAGAAPVTLHSDALTLECLDSITALSGGIPGLVRLLLFQSAETLNYLIARRNDQATSTNMPSYMSSANTVRGSATTGTNSPASRLAAQGSTIGTLGASSSTGHATANPYSGLPSLYSIGWELQQPAALSFTDEDRLLFYALSPLLYLHLHLTPTGSSKDPTGSIAKFNASGSSPNPPASPSPAPSAPGARTSTVRPLPLMFDGSLAWHLSKDLFLHQVIALGTQNSVQTYTGRRGVAIAKPESQQDQAYQKFLHSWNKMVVTGWFQEWNQGLIFPTITIASEAYSTMLNTVVHFTDAAVPQFLTVKKAMLANLSAAACEVASEEQLMKSYLQYVTRKFREYSEVLAVIDKLLITPEAGYQSTLLQQRQLLVLRSVDHLLLPHFTLLTSLMTAKLTAPARSDRSKKAAVRPESKIASFKVRSTSGLSNKSSTNNAESFFAAEASEDDGEHSDHRSDRAPSISSENSDPIQLLRDGTRSNSGRMSEAIDQALSYSLEEEDRASEDGGHIPKRMRTTSEASSDDGGEHYNYAHNAERGLQNLNAPPSESAVSDSKTSADEESYLMSSADAKDILSQWNGHLKHLSLLRLAPDLCTTLAVHSSKNLDSAAKSAAGPDATSKKVDYALAVLDLGLLLQELYLEHSSESNLSSGWSRGSLHYTSVESAVSRHLAASSSKLLQEASEVIQRVLRAGSTTATAAAAVVPAKPSLSKKMIATVLGVQTKIECALGHLSLAISAEALRMSLIAGASTSKIDEILVVKLHNKSRIAQTHGLDILQNVLPATAAQLSAVLDSLDESPHRSTPIKSLSDPWEEYRAELNHYVVPIASTVVVATPPPSPVKGIGMGTAKSAEAAAAADASDSIVLPDNLSTLLDKLYVRKLEGDAVLLVAEHFVQQALNRKLGEVNATFVQCMAPPAPAPAKADDSKDHKSEAVTIRSSPSDSNLPLPKGILPATRSVTDLAQRENTADGLIKESKPVTETPPRGKSAVFFADQSNKEQETAAKKKLHKNIMFPILLHSGRQDLLRELLDREFLVHQQKFLDKLAIQQDALNVSTLATSGLPSPVNNKSPPRSAGKPGVANPLMQDEPSLLFSEELSAEEDAELAAMNTPVTAFIATKFTNAALVHCWRVAKQNYEAAMQVYVKLFGANSIAAAETRILLANLYRYFGRDDEAKPLYELSLKVFKAQSIATFQLPTPTIAHCWLGLASYFDQHNSVLSSVYDSRIAVVDSTAHKSKNDLALRLYDEALNIYKCVYPSTHFNVGLTAQAVVGVLTGLKRYGRAITLLIECIDSTKLVLGRDRIMQRYMNRQLRLITRKPTGRSAVNSKKNAARITAIARLERSIESNELALQATIGYLGALLVSLARLHDHNKQHHLAIVLYKEAIVCFRELRLSIIRRYRARQDANAAAEGKTDGENADTQADEVEQIVTNQPERELALRLAQTMRDLAQSLFDEGVKQMGGRRANGLSLPDFQYRHALYVINRAIEIYHGFDLSVSAVLLKDTYTQKAAMHIQQGELESAKSCYEQIMRLFMEVKFQNYEDIAAVRTEYGRLMVQCGESGEAALLFQQAIDVYRRKRGENWIGIEVAENLLERGAALLDLKVYDEAQPCLEDVLKMLPMVLGESVAVKDPRFAACHNHLAAVFHFYEEYDEALVHYKAAQQTYINAGMHFSLEMANVCNNLATLHDDMGQLAEAKEMYEQTVVILFRFHGAAHPQILVTLENLMNLLQDMGLKEEHQSVLDHLDVMEKQIVQANKDDIERTEALNRALYGQAIADQERRQLKAQTRRMDQSAHPASPTSTSGANGNAFSTAGDFSPMQPSQSQRHPFAPEVVIVGGGTYEDDSEDDAGEEAFGGYNADVLLNFQAQEQAQYDDQQDSFFTLGLQRNTSTTRMVTAEEEWCRTNSARTMGRGGAAMDDHQDEEDGGQWGIKTGSALESAAREAARHGSLNLDLDYLGNYNNSSELHAMKQDLTSKYSASGSGGSAGESLAQKSRFGGEARRGAPGGKIRSLKPLGPVGSRSAAATQQAEQDDELPAGNCAIM